MEDSINNNAPRFSSAAHAMGFGAVRFGLVSLVAYGLWAFGKMGMVPLYVSMALAFAGLTGLLLFPLVEGANRILRFYAVFVPGFLLYAGCWCLGWFGIGGHVGEVFGSVAGLAVMALILCLVFGNRGAWLEITAVLFLWHTLGYYLGDRLYSGGHGPEFIKVGVSTAKLLWGLPHGIGFGAGLGYAFYKCQRGGRDNDASPQ